MKQIDATKGPMLKAVFAFSIPLILATIAQSLFDATDKAVLAYMAGNSAVAAVGATGAVTSLIINGAVGLATGVTIVLSRFWGEKDKENIRLTIDTAIISAICFGIIVAIAGFILAPVFLTITNCPKECFDGSLLYIRIYLSAAPITLFYNYGSAVLRTTGDSQRPLLYILAGGVFNVVFNIILCLILPEKVAAVAIATVASKLISGLLVAKRLASLDEEYARVRFKSLRFNLQSFTRILRFGIPTAISSMVIPLGNLQITSAINSFGVDAIAGNSAAASIIAIVSAFTGGFSSATSIFMGQNIGAKNPIRVKKAFWCSSALNVITSGTLGALVFFSGEFWIGLIIGFDEINSINYGMLRLLYVCLPLIINAINASMGGAIQAFGYAGIRSISNVAFNLGFRVIWMQFIYPINPTFGMIMQCYLVSWILNMAFYLVLFIVVYIRYTRFGICKKI